MVFQIILYHLRCIKNGFIFSFSNLLDLVCVSIYIYIYIYKINLNRESKIFY